MTPTSTTVLRMEPDNPDASRWVLYPYNDFTKPIMYFESEKEARKYCRDNNFRVSWVWIMGRR